MLKTSKWEWCLSSKIAARWSRKCTNFLWHSCNEVLYWPNSSVWNCSLLLSLLLLPAVFILPYHLFRSPLCLNHTVHRQVVEPAHVSQTSSHIQELHYLAGLNKSEETGGTKMKGRWNHVRNSCGEISLHIQCVMQVYIMEMWLSTRPTFQPLTDIWN